MARVELERWQLVHLDHSSELVSNYERDHILVARNESSQEY